MNYNFKEIEEKWQKHWENTKAFKVVKNEKPKFYALEMFPYPSGNLHKIGRASCRERV